MDNNCRSASRTTARPTGVSRSRPTGPSRARSPRRVRFRVHTLDSLHYRDFRLLLVANAIASGAGAVNQVVIGWLTYDLTGSPLLTALALTTGSVPLLLVGPLAGVLVDRWDRAKLLAMVFASRGVLTLGLGITVTLDRVGPWHIFGFMALNGLSMVLYEPARSSLIPNIVPKGMILNAFALRSMAGNAVGSGMPAVAGFLIAALGPGRTLLAAVPLLLAGAAAALAIKVRASARSKRRPGSMLADLTEGASYVRREPIVLGVLAFAVLPMVLAYPFVTSLMPVYASDVFEVGPAGLGILLSALGVGATLGSFVLASVGDIRRKGRAILYGLALTSAAMVAFSQAPTTTFALPVLALFTVGLAFFVSVSSAFVQALVPDSLRGRVSALLQTTAGVYPVGAVLAGGLAEVLGAQSSTLIAAIILAILSTALALRFKSVWQE